MYDRETETEWKHPSGVAISGELEGTRLDTVPAPMVTWERFRADNPDGVVLQPVRGGDPSDETIREIYDLAPSERYADGDAFGRHGMRGEGEPRSWHRENLDAIAVVLGVEQGGTAVGYPVPRVEAAGGVVIDAVGGREVVVFATDDGVHAVGNPGFDFEGRDDGFRADGTTWNGVAGESADGHALERVPARRLFAFAWQDVHGADAVYP